MKAVFFTRSDISWYSRNANAYQKPYQLSSEYELTLCVSQKCRVPDEISSRVSHIVRLKNIFDFLFPNRAIRIIEKTNNSSALIFTGFDFPCMWTALRLKRETGADWTIFCWDPPALSHRDKFPPLRWAIDFVFRWFARRCDKLVLNIHPGLLEEIGFDRDELERWKKSGKLVLRMQDAFDGLVPAPIPAKENCRYDFGVLSNWTVSKGGPLMAAALARMSGKRCLWIGDPPKSNERAIKPTGSIVFTGRLPQERAFEELSNCRVLVVPYLPVRSLKWNYVLKVFEYLQLGRPILASDNPGNASVAERFPGRITLFRSGDVADLIEKTRQLT